MYEETLIKKTKDDIKVKSSTFTYTDQDNIDIFVYKWEPETKAKAAVQFNHGMAEHAKRYDRVAEALCKEGYICYANDHRGHGMTAGDLTEATLEGKAGFLGPNGWQGTVNSVHQLTGIIKKENPDIPVFLIGHSFGSFLSQDIIQEWGSELKGVILSGTNGKIRKLVLKGGRMIAKKELKNLGPVAPSPKMDKLSFKTYNIPWENDEGATGFEWLSRDKAEVKKYLDDPWCGFISPASLYVEMFNGFEKIWNKTNELKIPKDLAVYFISGSECPVGRETKDVTAIIERYKEYGINDVSFKFYKDARHEIFNETNRDEVFKDVIDWLNSHL